MTHPCRAARPQHETTVEAVRDEFIGYLTAGNYIETSAALVGASRAVIYKWIARGVRQPNVEPWGSFARDVKAAVAKAEARDVAHIAIAGKDDWRAAAWYLERRAPKRWGQRVELQLRQEVEGMLDVAERVLRPEDYGRLAAALADRADEDASDG